MVEVASKNRRSYDESASKFQYQFLYSLPLFFVFRNVRLVINDNSRSTHLTEGSLQPAEFLEKLALERRG